MLIVDRLNRATNHDHAVSGSRAYGFDDRGRLRVSLGECAQTEGTSKCEQNYAFQGFSYRQSTALLCVTCVMLAGTMIQALAS